MSGRMLIAAGSLLLLALPLRAHPQSAPAGFAEGAEKALADKACTTCHAAAVATSQRRDKAGWTEIVEKMIGAGAQVPDDKIDALIAYLAASYPEKPH